MRLVDVNEDLLVVDVVVQGYHGNLAFTKLSTVKRNLRAQQSKNSVYDVSLH